MKKIYLILICSVFSIVIEAQYVKRGTIADLNGFPLAGVSVLETSTGVGTITDANGNFSIELVSDSAQLLCSYVGYKSMVLPSFGKSDFGKIRLEEDTILLKDVTITSQIAKSKATPTPSSLVSYFSIDEKLGAQEFPVILKSTPGVHPNVQGGGWGDSEIWMRGFDNSHVSVLVNGIPVNDMENGALYWSNWAGLADVTEQIQTQRGIGANIISTQSLGGSINIITKGISSKRNITMSYSLGNDGYNKILFSASSGLLRNGWSFTVLGSKTWGNGYAIGADYSVYSYFVNISKRINAHHQLSLTGFGAPQQHHSRSCALTNAEWNKVKDFNLFGKDYSQYNPEYGFDSNGQRKSSEFNKYHKPQISLNHIWQIDHKSSLSTTAYASIGYGYAFSGEANSDTYTEYDWYGADYGILNTEFRNADGTFDYAKIESINDTSSTGSQMVMTKLNTSFQWYGLVSTYKNTFLDCLNMVAGIDIRYYKGLHRNVISDLYGGKYYIDPAREDVSIVNNSIATDEWKAQHLHTGDVVHRDYDGNVMQEGAFAQLEYDGNSISSFVAGAINYTSFWRYDRMYYERSKARSETVGFVGGSVKAGFNYKINRHNNLYANFGYVSNVPPFKNGVFMSANNSNIINRNARNEKAITGEVGYQFANSFIQFAVNGYITEYMDKTMTKKGKAENKTQYYMNMSGVSARHMGIEFEATATPVHWLELSAMVSLGDWRWDSDSVKGLVFDTYGQAITPEGNPTQPGAPDQAWAIINMKGVHVGGSAQTTASFDVLFKPYKGARIGACYTLYDRNYAYYALSGGSLKLGKVMNVSEAWRIPLGGTLDLRASYSFNVRNVNMTIAGIVNNVIGQRNIEKAWNPTNVSSEVKEVNPDDVYFFYSPGRTWNVKLKIQF